MPSVTAATARARARLETVNKRLAVRPRGDQLTADITQHNTIDFRRHAAITPHNTTQLRTPAPRLSLPRPGASARQDTGHPGCSVVFSYSDDGHTGGCWGWGLASGWATLSVCPLLILVQWCTEPAPAPAAASPKVFTQRQEQQQRLGAAEMRCRYYSVIARRNNISLHTQDQ